MRERERERKAWGEETRKTYERVGERKRKNILKNFRLCLVTIFVFYFQKKFFENIKKKQFSCIFEIKNMFG